MTWVDYQRVATTYQEGRSPLARPEDWGQLIDEPRRGDLRVLDLGAGTGIFTRAWPSWGASRVTGLDASPAMLTEAQDAGLPPQATLVAGNAERLPFRSESFDVAWLSAVIHHIADRETCARELARVLVARGHVYIRGFFAGSSHLDWLDHFPGADRATARFPSVDDIGATFADTGFRVFRVHEVSETPRPVEYVCAWIEMMRHADTLLTAMTDHEIDIGLRALETSDQDELGGSLHLVVLEAV
jgi:SAM-dependent methyltransferase